jgi:hypothetical protein
VAPTARPLHGTDTSIALPDTELDGFVDALARRLASFDRRPIAAAKHLINRPGDMENRFGELLGTLLDS